MKKKYYIVYRTDNLVNGKYYHGCHITDNLNDTYLGSGVALLHAVNKYGKDSFKRTIIGFYDSRELMLEAEKAIVNHEDPMSYNLMPGGAHGGDLSKTAREKISESKKGKPFRDEHRQSLSDALKGNKLSPETRKKISEAGKGRVVSAETRRKMSEARKDIKPTPHSAETRRKISEGNKGKVMSAEARAKISKGHMGKTVSIETRNRIADARRGKPRSPETITKLRDYHERKRNEKFRDELPDQTGSFHFSYGDELGDDFLTMDTSLKSHLDDKATYQIPKPMTMRLACGTST